MSPEPAQESGRPVYRSMRREDFGEVLALILASFGDGWPGFPILVPARDHLAWKIGYPELDPDLCSILELDGRVIGYAGGRGWDAWVRGRQIPGSFRGDYCVHPAFQGRGLTGPWREWQDELVSTVPALLGIGELSTHPRLIRQEEHRGRRSYLANHVERLTKPLDWRALAFLGSGDHRRVTPATLARGARALAQIGVGRLRWSRPALDDTGLDVRTVSRFDERVDRLWAQARVEFEYSKIRTRDSLNWRYGDPRAGVYRIRTIEDCGELVGYMVTGAKDGDGLIADVLVAPGRPDALGALISDASTHLAENGAYSLTVMLPSFHSYRATFLGLGFIKVQEIGSFGFDQRDESPMKFLTESPTTRIHIAAGDYDHI